MVHRTALVLLAALVPLGARALEVEKLYGTWQLVSLTQRIVATGEIIQTLGPNPKGFLSYGRDGRMSAMLVSDGRPKRADMSLASVDDKVELFNSMVAYAGTFTVDGDTVTHHIDISWNESWTGANQLRVIRLEGNKLYLSTHPQPSGIDGRIIVGELVWEKRAPSVARE